MKFRIKTKTVFCGNAGSGSDLHGWTGQLAKKIQRTLGGGMSSLSENPVRMGQREQQIVELLLQGCDNDEIARQLKMARRTVKAHFNRLFLRFGIRGGIKRVKLATLMYRKQLSIEGMDLSALPEISPADANAVERAVIMSSDNRHEDADPAQKAETLEAWEHNLLELGEPDVHEQLTRGHAVSKETQKQLA